MASSVKHPGSKKEVVRALARGLAVLRHVNKVGEARPAEIATTLGIPRPTVYRLLETLEELGYVVFSGSASYVRVTRFAASLSDGYALTSELCQVAAPIFAGYGERLVWPLDLTVYNNAAMVIQETTHGRSPLSVDRGMAGYKLPILRTSAGRAYVSFCPDNEREIILDHIRALDDPEDLPFLEPRWLNRMIEETRARGFAVRDAGEFREQTASLAAPIKASGAILGCVSIIWIRSAMNTAKAFEEFSSPLQAVAADIAALLPD